MKNYPYLAGIFLNIIVLAGFVDVSLSAETTVEYRDPKGRFTFEAPASWGAGQRGTNDGFGDRVAAIQFQKLASGQRRIMGGEAVLTQGRVMLDMQTLGGLYDVIALEVLPPTLQKQVLALLPSPTPSNFCKLLGKSRHLDSNHPKLSHLKPALRQGLVSLGRTRNISPKVISCTRTGDTFTYHKEATYQIGAMQARQHLYGAVRFLKGKYSSFQVVRVETQPPDKSLLATLTHVVQSFKNLK